MKSWLRRIRGVVGMALTWAIAWAVVGGGIMEGIVDPDGKILDMWPQTLAIPGFLSGLIFSFVLWIGARRRRFEELSLPRFAAWGGVAGALLGVFAVATGAAHNLLPLWQRVAVIIGPMTLLGAISATGTLAVARMAERRQLRAGDAEVERASYGKGRP